MRNDNRDMKTNLANKKVVNLLPSIQGKGDKIPKSLIGSKIVNFGTFSNLRECEGGGLVIDYRQSDNGKIKRVVFGFSELGMWVEYIGKQNERTKVKEIRCSY